MDLQKKRTQKETKSKPQNTSKNQDFGSKDKNKKTVKQSNSRKKKIKKKKKINTNAIKLFIKVICILVIFVGIIMFLMISPIFNISEIDIENNKKISKETYISLSGIKYGENIYRINKKAITANIKENPYVESINISRKLPNKVVIQVKERTAKFMIKTSDKYMYIDSQGYMLELSKDKINVPIIVGIETKEEDIKINNRLCENDLEKFNKVLEIYQIATTNEISDLITEIDISDKSDYKLILESEKKNIYLRDGTDLVNKFTWIKKILEDKKDESGDIHANRSLNSQPVYFSPTK